MALSTSRGGVPIPHDEAFDVGRMKLQQGLYVVRRSPCTPRSHGVLVGGILWVHVGSLVESLDVMTVAESILGPHHTLKLARGHSRMQVWSSANIDE